MNNFSRLYPSFSEMLIARARRSFYHEQQEQIWSHFTEFVDYNLPKSDHIEAKRMIGLYYTLIHGQNPNLDQNNLYIVAWIISTITTLVQITEDMVNNSKSRWGHPCWYRLHKDNELTAPISGLILISSTFLLYRDLYFDKPFGPSIEKLLHECFTKSNYGLALSVDGKSLKGLEKPELFYYTLTKNKTGYLYELSINTAIYLAGYWKLPFEKKLLEFEMKLGYFQEFMNDFHNLYGKTTDEIPHESIRKGRLTWFSAHVLDNGTEKQKSLLLENYGKEDDVHVKRILELYEDSILREKFMIFKAKFMGDFLREIETFAKPKIATYIENIALSIAS